MDFLTLSRRELQALCKKNKIPANMTNVAMADALNALPQVEGMDGNEQEFLSPVKLELFTPRPPRTSTRSSARRSSIAVEKAVDEMEQRTVTRSTRRSVKKEEEVKEITDGIAFIKISDTPSAVTGRKAPRARQTAKKAVSEKIDVKSKEIGAHPADKMMTSATIARRSSARLRSKVTIGSQTPMAVKEETIEETDGCERTTRTKQYSRRRSELSLGEKEKGSSGEIEKMKGLLFPDEIQEQKESQPWELKNTVEENCELSGITVETEIADAAVEKLAIETEVNSDETVDLTVVIHSEITGEEEPICNAVVAKPAAEIEVSSNEKVDLTDAVDSETPVNEEGETLVPVVVVETLNFGESSGEILVTPFCCDEEFEEEVLNVDENTGEMEFDELSTEVDDEESLEELSYEIDAAVESEEPSRPNEEEITVEVELSAEKIPVIAGAMVSDEGSLDETSCKNVTVVELEELSVHDEEESTFVVESCAETPAIPTEPRIALEIEGSLEEITCEDVAAMELDESPNHDEEEITVDVESSVETPAIVGQVKEDGAVNNPAESTVALSPIRAEAIILTENPEAVDDVVTTNLSDAIFELSELFAKAVTSESKTPTSAKPHLVLQDRMPTSTKKSTVKRVKTVDENCDKENVGFNCNNNTILFAGDNGSAMKQHQQMEDHDLKVMSLRQLKLEYKKVMSKKNLDNKNENMEEVKKRTALTPLKENCMKGISN